MATGERHWYIVRCYLAPGYVVTIRDVEAAMNERPGGAELIFAGDLNINLERTERRGRDEEIAAAVVTAGLVDLLGNFLPQQRTWCKYRRTWEMVQKGRVVRSQTDYILGSN